jgi:hypothetical protein
MYFSALCIPWRLKPRLIFCFLGTAKAVPFKTASFYTGPERVGNPSLFRSHSNSAPRFADNYPRLAQTVFSPTKNRTGK